MQGDLLVDLRNVYPPEEVTKHGFTYIGVGRGNTQTGNGSDA
jgi:UDPglucose 6-dehydrogenase